MLRRIIASLLLVCMTCTCMASAEEITTFLPELSAQLGTFPKNQRYEVYEALIGSDDTPNRRAGNGKAVVSTNGDIWVYATWKEYLLIEYDISGNRHRFGWTDASKLPAYTLEGVPELPRSWDTEQNIYGVVTRNTYLTDDPRYDGIDPSILASVPIGTSVRCLGSLEHELLVECFIGQEQCMGFVGIGDVVQNVGFAENAIYTIDKAGCFTEKDIRRAMNAVTAVIEETWPGTSVLELRYMDADHTDPEAWWRDESGEKEAILLYADLNSMELWDHEIAGYAIARGYIFILYRTPGSQWRVCNWGYT